MQLTVNNEIQHEDGTVQTGEVTFIGEPHEWEWLVTVTPLFAESSLARSVENLCASFGVAGDDE